MSETSTSGTIVLRSLIKTYFPVDLLVKLELVAGDHTVSNNEKTEEVIDLLNEYKVPFSPLGNGTNRYGILIDGYAVKVALDRAGQIDNMREFKYAKIHYPDVVKVYECTPEKGTVAVFEYITIFSLADMYDHQDEMREILGRITQKFLVGDMGISSNNYINWGTRADGSIAILDFAYIYSLSYKGFMCSCEDEGMLEYDKDFNYLICPYCRKKYTFAEIRKRISKQDELNEIGDIRDDGYVLHSAEETQPVDYNESTWRKKKEKKKKKEHIHQKKQKPEPITFESQLESLNALMNLTNGGTINYGQE